MFVQHKSDGLLSMQKMTCVIKRSFQQWLCLLQMVNLSPTSESSNRDSPSAFFDTTSADSTPLNTKNPSFEAQLPEDSKQRVNKGFRVSEILGTTHNSILEFFTNFAK